MKKVLVVIVCTLLWFNADCQKRKKQNENPPLKEKIWFGSSLNLGFSSGSDISAFQFGITPMVGYKLLPFLSIGPKLGFNLTNYRYRFSNQVQKITLVSVSEGIFTRAKIFNYFFVHGEFEVQQNQFAYLSASGNKLEKGRENRQNLFAGLGYNSGSTGGLGSEIYLLYNFFQDENLIDQPFEFRAGFTYNF